MSPHRTILLTAAAALIVGVTPAQAASGFSSPRTVSGSGLAEQPQVAVGAAGRTLAVWNAQTGGYGRYDLPKGSIDARLGRVDGSLGATRTLTTSGSFPLAAVGSDSVAAVAWVTVAAHRVATVYVSIARAGHSFGRKRALASGVGVGGPSGAPSGMEVKPDGTVVVIWTRQAHSPPPFSSHEDLDYALVEPDGADRHGGVGAVTGPVSVAEAADGTVLVAAAAFPSGAPEATTLLAGARAFTGLQTIPYPTGSAGGAGQIGAFAGTGGAAVAFGAGVSQAPAFVFELTELAGLGDLGQPVVSTSPTLGADADGFAGPVVALPGDGAQVEGYTVNETNDPAFGNIVAAQVIAAIRPSGAAAFGAPAQLSASGAGIPSGPLAASAGDTSVIMWGQRVLCSEQVYTAVRPPGGVFGPAAPLGPRFSRQGVLCGHGDGGQLSMAGAGKYVIAGWLQSDRLRTAILTSPPT